MIPRKRIRPNPPLAQSTTSLPAGLSSQATDSSVASQANGASGLRSASPKASVEFQGNAAPSNNQDASGTTITSNSSTNQVRKSRSWYGSWPRPPKSTASTSVAKETIMGGTVRSRGAPDFSRFEIKKSNSPADSDNQSIRTLSKIPEAEIQPQQADTISPKEQEPLRTPKDDSNGEITNLKDQVNGSSTAQSVNTTTSANTPERASTSTGWPSWLRTGQAVDESARMSTKVDHDTNKSLPKEPPADPCPDTASHTNQPQVSPETPKPPKPASSWFGLWTTSSTSVQATGLSPGQDGPSGSPNVPMEDTSAQPSTTQPATGSTWAFWSRDTGSEDGNKAANVPEQGELAVIGDGSEASPRRSSGLRIEEESVAVKEPLTKTAKKPAPKENSTKKNKRGRPQPMEIDAPVALRPKTPQLETAVTKPVTPTTNKAEPRNLLLPSFRSTYHMKENPSIIKQIAQLLLRVQQPAVNHVFLAKEPPRIRKAIAIGVHGLFPAAYLRPMVGQPTGTSIRFANECAEAIRRWSDRHGCNDCVIEKIALEGEGKITDRVDNLWKLLLNWIEHIRSADLIVVACHSQGVPVGMMLLAKLIDLQIITTARLGVCAMAGVSLGPFPDYKSGMGMLMGSAAELWQFGDPESDVSKKYAHALEVVINYGGRVTYIGSIDDQLVPVESAIYSPANHPWYTSGPNLGCFRIPDIYRAVFIDGRIHAPDFIAHLVGFALKLRNLGISDHGLIRELSVPLAGSLYSGEGHSRIYVDDQVYDLAISHALETCSVSGAEFRIERHERLTNPNPYILPWIMRGLLEEDFVKTELYSETAELLKQFDDWTPSTKALKDVKYRLEAVRSRL